MVNELVDSLKARPLVYNPYESFYVMHNWLCIRSRVLPGPEMRERDKNYK